MNRFRKIILPLQGKNKKHLYNLYSSHPESNTPLTFVHNRLKFWFKETTYRSIEKLILCVQIPGDIVCNEITSESIPYETYLLRLISPMINELNNSYLNVNKNIREKARFHSQDAFERMIHRSGIQYNTEENAYTLQINFDAPLVNAMSINAKATIRAIKEVLEHIEISLAAIDYKELDRYIKTYIYQQEIRKYMKKHSLCSFVANGSILPRENENVTHKKGIIPFLAPKELEVFIPLFDGTQIAGMGIKNGVTVITGGGYSGKSTLLNAIEMGIYNHIPDSGREFILTDSSALKIYSEDGRPVSNLDISPFFKSFPGIDSLENFSTTHASGSVSQAANIIEAVCGKCKLLLIDEDKSATNFMIRDKNMRLIVKDEPIIPFTDRVRELFEKKEVSTILVIGGSSEYLSVADTVVLMKDYQPRVITEDILNLDLPKLKQNERFTNWTESRYLIPKESSEPFLYFKKVELEDEKRIVFDEYSTNITLLSALTSKYQFNTLVCVIEQLLTDKNVDNMELLDKIESYIKKALTEYEATPRFPDRFCEDVRPIDVFCCINRMRGLRFSPFQGNVKPY